MFVKFSIRACAVGLLLCGLARPSQAGGIGDIVKGFNPFGSQEALTTNIKDAKGEIPYLDNFDPLNSGNIFALPRNDQGEFMIRPGAYSGSFQSYCLHAGTYGPTQGAGYVTAPLKGKKARLISRFLTGAGAHPEVPQHDVQSLIWAVEARSSLSPQMTQTAIRLLAGRNGLPDPKDLLELNGGVESIIPLGNLRDQVDKAKSFLRPILEARNTIKQLTANGGSFEEMAAVAVLHGEPPASQQVRTIPGNRWVYAPSGVFVRYQPSGYSQTNIQVFCPEPFFVRSEQSGLIREIETKDHSYKLETIYDEAEAASAQHGVTALVLSHSGKDMLRVNMKGVSVTTGAPTTENAAMLQDMQQQFIGKKPRNLTGLVVNFTNYRDSISQALTGLSDQNQRNLLNDFISRAWIATTYQWINENGNGVRTSQRIVEPGVRPGFQLVQLQLIPILIEIAVGDAALTAGEAAAIDAGVTALNWASTIMAICPGNTSAQRLGICPRPIDPSVLNQEETGDVKRPAIPYGGTSAPVASLPGGDPDDIDGDGKKDGVDDLLEDAKPRKPGKSEQWDKDGGFGQANRDFDKIARGNPVKDQGGGVRSTELPDGTTVSVRPTSTGNLPTIQINRPNQPPIKIRYNP